MPNLDGMGPIGLGARTGKGFGNCNYSKMQVKQSKNIWHETGRPHPPHKLSDQMQNDKDLFIRQQEKTN